MAGFTRQQIDTAYRKLKSYVYYDNFSLLLRQQIAHFESGEDFENRLNALTKFLSKQDIKNTYFQNLLSSIDCYLAPKKFEPLLEEKQLVISNNFSAPFYNLESANYFFKGEVELHIISVLWIIHEGYLLHNSYQKDNYAYHLEIDKNNGEVVDGIRLFKPYYEQYQKWRDNGINRAKHFLKEDTDVVLLSLDIKRYYYNASIDEGFKKKVIETLKIKSKKRKYNLTELLFSIMSKYQGLAIVPNDSSLPIGLLSSGILANFYLVDFDTKIKSELSPAYYGRYVDDIQIVLSNTRIGNEKINDSKVTKVSAFLDKYLVDRNIFTKENIALKSKNIDPCLNKDKYFYRFIDDKSIEIQQDKILLYSFESKESQAVLDMFKKRIEQNSSAFWFLPAENDLENDFDESVYDLSYSDTINKLRSVKGINQSKYGAAVYLAKKIKVSLLSSHNEEDKTTTQILTFFKGIVSLEFVASWEKVFTYFVIINDKESFWKFFKEITQNIDKLILSEKAKVEGMTSRELKNVKGYLNLYLENCCALATGLNPNFLSDYWWEKRKESVKLSEHKNAFAFWGKINAIKRAYVKSNLIRNSFVVTPLLNYLQISHNRDVNFIKHDELKGLKINLNDLEFDEFKLKYSPRYIHFYEFNLAHLLRDLLKYHYGDNNSSKNKDIFFNELDQSVFNRAFNDFFLTNHVYRLHILKKDVEHSRDTLRKFYFDIGPGINDSNNNLGYNSLDVPFSSKNLKKFKVALANTPVHKSNIVDSIFNKPNTNHIRRKEFITLLNDTEKEKADALILPEVSIPYSWLPLLLDESRRKQRMIIAGLEHLVVGKKVFNFLATCLPFEHNGIKDALIHLRIKYHYSPGESKLIESKRLIVPQTNFKLYNLFKWRGLNFSNYNCYELADINHRALFKGKVDALFASEYNQDVNYFSNIAESVNRDVHCYFIQVNTSDYGDSRITVPKKHALKDIMRLKGGENHVILTSRLDILAIREFQKTSVPYQNTDDFKNTPPDYDHDSVNQR